MYNGLIIRQMLKERHLKNSDLLEYIGSPGAKSINQLTHGNPTAERLERVADFFKCSMDIFFKRSIVINPFNGSINGNNNAVGNVNYSRVQELEAKIYGLERLIEEKDKRIDTLEEMVNLLKK